MLAKIRVQQVALRDRWQQTVTRAVGADWEPALSRYFDGYVGRSRPALLHVLTHPRDSATAALAVLYAPRHVRPLPDGADAESAVIRDDLRRLRRPPTPLHRATSVLVLPREGADYLAGASKQTLRRKVRAAQKMGVTWSSVEDVTERRRLLDLAVEHERCHPQLRYRNDDPAHEDLLGYRLWLAAYAKSGRPLLLSVTPVAGPWALLRYFRTLGDTEEESAARYLMTSVLVEQLVARGVEVLVDSKSPVTLKNGLRHFQRMLGFRVALVETRSAPAVPS